jgi:hypothetical protein
MNQRIESIRFPFEGKPQSSKGASTAFACAEGRSNEQATGFNDIDLLEAQLGSDQEPRNGD